MRNLITVVFFIAIGLLLMDGDGDGVPCEGQYCGH